MGKRYSFLKSLISQIGILWGRYIKLGVTGDELILDIADRFQSQIWQLRLGRRVEYFAIDEVTLNI